MALPVKKHKKKRNGKKEKENKVIEIVHCDYNRLVISISHDAGSSFKFILSIIHWCLEQVI